MLTRCPRCQTLFRVTPEQLKARQGRVRCGHCQAVFDALEALEDEARPVVLEAAAPVPEAPPAPVAPPPPQEDADAALEDSVFTSVREEPIEPSIVPAEPELDAEAPAEPQPAPARKSAAPVEAEPATEEALGLESLIHEEEAPRRRAWPWVLGVVVAVLVLGLQALFQLRVDLAVLYPSAKPALVALCRIAGCEVPLPQKIDLIGIDASDLHPDPSGNGRLVLVASLRNRAPFAQPYPDLEVTLTDTADHALVRRVFAPAEYLPAEAARGAFAPRSEQPINLLLEAPGLPAVGYRLYVFYP